MRAPLARPLHGPARALRNAALLVVTALAGAGAAAAEPVTVVALGDSLTAGYGLGAEEGFVPRLQAWLDDHGADVAVVNAGVSGDTTAAGLSRADWALGDGADAVIVALGGNDWLRGIDPALSRANLDSILDKADALDLPALLVGIDAGANYGPDYEAAFDAMYVDLAREHGALLAPDWFGAIRVPGRSISASAPFLQGDGIHPNAEGVARIVAELGPMVVELADEAREEAAP